MGGCTGVQIKELISTCCLRCLSEVQVEMSTRALNMRALNLLGAASKCVAFKAMRLDAVSWRESPHRAEAGDGPSKFERKMRSPRRRLGGRGGRRQGKPGRSGVS